MGVVHATDAGPGVPPIDIAIEAALGHLDDLRSMLEA